MLIQSRSRPDDRGGLDEEKGNAPKGVGYFMNLKKLWRGLIAFSFWWGVFPGDAGAGDFLIFAGAASKPPTEEVARIYQRKGG